MKKQLVKALHTLFRIKSFEKLLYSFANGSYIGSFISKLVPPNTTYSNPEYRTATRIGYKVNLNLNDYNDWKAYWGLKEEEREALYKLAQNCVTVVDIGVNNGWVMMNLAKIVKQNDGKVYGFEPYPPTYSRAVSNISSNKITNAILYNLGCGDTDAEVKMVSVISTNSGQNRIVEDAAVNNEENLQVVKIVRLDEYLNNAAKIDLIKIDVEGFEKKVLEGAVDILQKDKPVLFIEVDDRLLKANNSSAANLISFLEKFNYSITLAKTGQALTTEYSLDNCHMDIICK